MMMGIFSIIPVELKPMSIITLILFVMIVFIFYLIYMQIRKDIKDHKITIEDTIGSFNINHNELKKDFEDTRDKLYDKINEVKDDFSDVKITVARTQEMIKGSIGIQNIIQSDITEIRKRLNKI